MPRFDPAGLYELDLAHGTVKTRGGDRVVVLSDTVLGPLVSAAAAAGDLTPVRALGEKLGEAARGSLEDAAAAGPEAVLGEARAVFGAFGWGRLGLERWGDALVATVDGAPGLDDAGLGLAALLGGLFSALAGREVSCVPASGGRFLLVDPSVAEQVWSWAEGGADVASLVGRLHRPEGA